MNETSPGGYIFAGCSGGLVSLPFCGAFAAIADDLAAETVVLIQVWQRS